MGRKQASEGLPMEVLERAAMALRVLAHPHRLKMIELLMSGPIAVGELADEIGLAPAATSQHLNHMRAHGIVEKRRDGRLVYYEVVHSSALTLMECVKKDGLGQQSKEAI